ncbi:hypothetical protein NT01EI_0008 [Edwardsiella ictaluri 93-146]|uniref:Uncharacterized protein n=1 Tax=Edwardsiella ictaluri (strain 93-146) TaxID=634503 RepID=C5BHD2_EDWI9|nr:hypothetical protein NT01EI_0008 [Edwardsiella ictaluri 93-146]
MSSWADSNLPPSLSATLLSIYRNIDAVFVFQPNFINLCCIIKFR